MNDRYMLPHQKNIIDVAKLFIKLGVIAFGGPAAHIAMMQDEVVNKRKWMSEQHFLDLIGATNLIPGPNSTEMAIHIGRERAGWKGLIVAGICFILPAVLITGFFAWLYKQYGNLPQVQLKLPITSFHFPSSISPIQYCLLLQTLIFF